MAWLLHFVQFIKDKQDAKTGHLTVDDFDAVTAAIVRIVQGLAYAQEIKDLKSKRCGQAVELTHTLYFISCTSFCHLHPQMAKARRGGRRGKVTAVITDNIITGAKSSKVASLNPKLDESGILRVNGRGQLKPTPSSLGQQMIFPETIRSPS